MRFLHQCLYSSLISSVSGDVRLLWHLVINMASYWIIWLSMLSGNHTDIINSFIIFSTCYHFVLPFLINGIKVVDLAIQANARSTDKFPMLLKIESGGGLSSFIFELLLALFISNSFSFQASLSISEFSFKYYKLHLVLKSSIDICSLWHSCEST